MDSTAFWQDLQARSERYWQRRREPLGALSLGTTPYWSVVIVGLPGVGKSTLLRHLVHPLPVPTGPTAWPVRVLTADPPILWTDTPGWTPERSALIQEALASAELCLWVTSPQLPPELAQQLRDWGRPVIQVLPWSSGEPPVPPPPAANCLATAVVRLFPVTQPVRLQWPDGRVETQAVPLPVDVGPVRTLLAEAWQQRTALTCVNRLLWMARREREWIAQKQQAPLPWWPLLLKALVVTLTPGLGLKLAVSWLADVGAVLWLSRCYRLPLTPYGLEKLVLALGLSSTLVAFGSGFIPDGEGLVALGGGFWGGLTAYGVQRVARRYLCQGATWAMDGPWCLLRRIQQQLTPGTPWHAWVSHCLQLVGNLS
ncbi:MAG: GTPase [Gloeomargarita sp. GMQP_bins_14]